MDRTDTTPADNQQLAGIFAALQQGAAYQAAKSVAGVTHQEAAEHQQMWDNAYPAAEQGDPQWAGPSLPHPTEATSEAERAELDEGWDNWQHGIEPNHEQIEA